ncbi:MAG: HotDog domain-containing protein [Piptocephalis tieghemiana]|nr:MAG: HotDog domain-containing protein [Piptocephalis tieghemiana]
MPVLPGGSWKAGRSHFTTRVSNPSSHSYLGAAVLAGGIGGIVGLTLLSGQAQAKEHTPHAGLSEGDTQYFARVNEKLESLEEVKALRTDETVIERDYYGMFADFLAGRTSDTHLTYKTLRGENKLTAPLVFQHMASPHGREFTIFILPGRDLCSHPGVIHGGMLATLVDETMALAAFSIEDGELGFTARLEIDYRKPVIAGKPIILRVWQEQRDGRKRWTRGRMEDPSGTLMLESKALYLEPRAALTNKLYGALYRLGLTGRG